MNVSWLYFHTTYTELALILRALCPSKLIVSSAQCAVCRPLSVQVIVAKQGNINNAVNTDQPRPHWRLCRLHMLRFRFAI